MCLSEDWRGLNPSGPPWLATVTDYRLGGLAAAVTGVGTGQVVRRWSVGKRRLDAKQFALNGFSNEHYGTFDTPPDRPTD